MAEEQILDDQINSISSSEFAAKANSKREIYQFLSQDARAYLPQPTLITIYFLKDLVWGKRKFVRSENVKHLHVPYYDSLSIKYLVHFGASNYGHLEVYFPEVKEQAKLPRQWQINVLYSTIGEPFAQFVKQKTQERNESVYVQKSLAVQIDPDVLAAFKQSTLVSLNKSATGASLLKVGSKRKRTKRQIEQEKVEQLQKEQQIAEKLQNIGQMEAQMQQMQAQVAENQQNTQLVNSLIEQGHGQFDGDGVFTIIENNDQQIGEPQNM